MAAYKVIQDIEAEDKLVGPLTFRQFIYAGIGAICLYLSFLALTKHAAFLIAVFLPIAGVSGFFAFPWGRDQPTEIWALAKIQFMFKPRRRVWNQSGVRELVTITVPKKIEQHYTNGLSETEVRSRLMALADTIDSRGWAIKNANINMYGQMAPILAEPNSDRLINISAFPSEVPSFSVQAGDDVLDADNNPVARQLDQMINASTAAHRQQIIENFRHVAPPTPPPPTPQRQQPVVQPSNQWFASQPTAAAAAFTQPTVGYAQPVMQPQNAVPMPGQPITPTTYAPTPQPTSQYQAQQPVADAPLDEAALMAKLHAQDSAQQAYNAHLHTIQPLGSQHAQIPQQPKPAQAPPQTAQNPAPAPVTRSSDPAILALANNDDLSVATIARQANKELQNSDEVVISLH